jgi:uncharacterized protein
MDRMIFVNLPVHDLKASEAFYIALGGTLNPSFSDGYTKSIRLSECINVMLLSHESYRRFTERPIGDAHQYSHALYALSADSRDAVNDTVQRAAAAGGRVDPNPVQDYGFMFNRAVEDPDGNVWEIVWMDPAAMTQSQTALAEP